MSVISSTQANTAALISSAPAAQEVKTQEKPQETGEKGGASLPQDRIDLSPEAKARMEKEERWEKLGEMVPNAIIIRLKDMHRLSREEVVALEGNPFKATVKGAADTIFRNLQNLDREQSLYDRASAQLKDTSIDSGIRRSLKDARQSSEMQISQYTGRTESALKALKDWSKQYDIPRSTAEYFQDYMTETYGVKLDLQALYQQFRVV